MTPARPLSPEQVAEIWGCSANHVRSLIHRHELRAFRLGPRLLRIPPDAIAEFEQCQTIESEGSRGGGLSLGGKTENEGAIVLTLARNRKPREKQST